MTLTVPEISTLTALVPVATLTIGVAIGNRVVIPDGVSESFGYMTTGLLVALIAIDIMPEILHDARTTPERLGAAFGFVTGGVLLIGMLAAGDIMNTPKDDDPNVAPTLTTPATRLPSRVRSVIKNEPDDQKELAFPIASVVSSFVLLLLDGLLIGIGLESSNETIIITLAMIMASTIGLDTFLTGVESAVLFKECKRPVWENYVITIVNCGLLLLGGFFGGALEKLKNTKKGTVGFFYILGTAMATALAMISQSHKTTVVTEKGPIVWYPQIFLYLGFLIMLVTQWHVKGLQGNLKTLL